MTKHVTCKFIQYKIDDCNFQFQHSEIMHIFSDLTKYKKNTCIWIVIRLLTSRALCTFWFPVHSIRAVWFQDFNYKLFILLKIWPTIRMRSDVHLHEFLFKIEWKDREFQIFPLQIKPYTAAEDSIVIFSRLKLLKGVKK